MQMTISTSFRLQLFIEKCSLVTSEHFYEFFYYIADEWMWADVVEYNESSIQVSVASVSAFSVMTGLFTRSSKSVV